MVGTCVVRRQFSPTMWFLGIRFRSLDSCSPIESPPGPHHHNLMKLVIDVIVSKNPGPRWNRGYFRQGTVVTQTQDDHVSVTGFSGDARSWTLGQTFVSLFMYFVIR